MLVTIKKTFMFLLVLLTIVSVSIPIRTGAITQAQRNVIDSGARYFNVENSNLCSVNNTLSGSSSNRLYVIGDSLTAGMNSTSLGENSLSSKLTSAGWSPEINAQGCRPLYNSSNPDGFEGNGSSCPRGTITSAFNEFDKDLDTISVAGTIVIALGTNNYESSEAEFISKGVEYVDKIKATNSGIGNRIFWVNTHIANGGKEERSNSISQIVSQTGIQLIDYRTEAINNPDTYSYPSNDITHNDQNGYINKVDLIVDALGDTQQQTGNGGDNGSLSLTFPIVSDETLLAAQIEEFVRSSAPSSPWLNISNLGTKLVAEGKKENVNPLVVVGIARKESAFGTSGNSALRANNSFGNKGDNEYSVGGYFGWSSWEASLFSSASNGSEETFFEKFAYRLSGQHVNYREVTNLYEYLSVHLSGRILYPDGSGTRIYDEIMGEFVDVSNAINYYESVATWIGEITNQTVNLDLFAAGSTDGCSISSGVVNGSIVETALSLAWTDSAVVAQIMAAREATDSLCSMTDDPSTCGAQKQSAGALISESDAKPEYVQAVREFNEPLASDGANWAFSDCGVFVSTVMKSSGVDANFPARGTTENMLPYLQGSEDYDTILFTDTSQLTPGDILIKPGHVAIYVGPNQQSDAVVVQASWGQNVPAANQSTVTPGDGYYRARKL